MDPFLPLFSVSMSSFFLLVNNPHQSYGQSLPFLLLHSFIITLFRSYIIYSYSAMLMIMDPFLPLFSVSMSFFFLLVNNPHQSHGQSLPFLLLHSFIITLFRSYIVYSYSAMLMNMDPFLPLFSVSISFFFLLVNPHQSHGQSLPFLLLHSFIITLFRSYSQATDPFSM